MNILKQDFFPIRGTSSTIRYSFPIATNNEEYTHIAVSSLSIPKTFYTLPFDSTLIISENGGPDVVKTFYKGNYTSQSFLSILNTKLSTGLSYTYILSYPDIDVTPDTGKYTLTVSGNSGNNVTLTINDEYLATMLGLVYNTVYTFSSTLESTNVISFQVYDKVIIKSDIVANSSGLLEDVVSSANPYFSSIVYKSPDPLSNAKLIRRSNFSNNNFSFSIMNALNRPIELNGGSWSIVVKLFTIDPVFQIVRDFIEVLILEDNKKQI